MMRGVTRRAGRRTEVGVAVLGALVLSLATTACGGDDGEPAGEAGGDRQSESPSPPEDSGSRSGSDGDDPGEGDGSDGGTDGGEGDGSDGGGESGGGSDDGGTDGGGGDSGGTAGSGGGGGQDRPFVINFYGEENTGGNPEREPANLVVTEHTSMSSVEWERWDGEVAVGSGLLSGVWCLPECLDDPFDAKVTLSDPEEINGELYYSTFELESSQAAKYHADDLDGPRPLAQPGR